MRLRRVAAILVLLSLPMLLASNDPAPKKKSVYDYSLVGTDGKEVSLATYKGKVLLIVTLASQSVYANQIAALKDLQAAYADKGLVVLGVPSGDFGSEELADNPAIEKYYKETQHVNFAIFAKTSVRGKDTIPLVRFLTDPKQGGSGGDVHWSFTKFLVDREGHPVLRLEADSDPAEPDFKVTLEQILNGTYKKRAAEKEGAPGGDDDDDE